MSIDPHTLASIMLAALAVWALAGWMRERRDAARQRKMFIDIMKDDSKVICMAFDALHDMAATAVKAAAGGDRDAMLGIGAILDRAEKEMRK